MEAVAIQDSYQKRHSAPPAELQNVRSNKACLTSHGILRYLSKRTKARPR